MLRTVLPCCALSILGLAFAGCGSDDASAPVNPGDPEDFMDEVRSTDSCALRCGQECAEHTQPWDCPAMRPWSAIPHAKECGGWNGKYPAVQPGQCTATEPSGEAIAMTNSGADPVVLPDGRRLRPAGTAWVFNDADLEGTFPFSVLWLPGTRFVVVSDDGYQDHALRVVDVERLAAGQDPTVSMQRYPYPESLNYGLALSPDGTVYAASGRQESTVFAFTVDPTTGELARDATKDVVLTNEAPGDGFPFGIDVTQDGKYLVAAQVNERSSLVYSLEQATYGQKIGAFDVGGKDQYAALFDPFEPGVAYVSVWNSQRVVEIDVASQQTRTIDTGRQPQELVFFDANYMGVAEAMSDTIAVVDRVSGKVVASVPMDPNEPVNAQSPTALAYDADNQRLYATLATQNAVAVFGVTPSAGPGQPPAFSHLGLIPTLWWPTDVVVAGQDEPNPGSLIVLSGKGVGGGPKTDPLGPSSHGTTGEQMKGGIQYVPFPDATALAGYTEAHERSVRVGAMGGNADVSCPAGVEPDFPVPRTTEEGPSDQIKNVIFIVRENKTFDAIMGDMPGVKGDPSLVLIPGKMEEAFGNIRKMAKTFSHGDNFNHSAEKSIQGHYWTVFGRSSDYTERTWLSTWGRNTRSIPLQGIDGQTIPEQGGIFHWLQAHGVDYDNMGELIGSMGNDVAYGSAGFVSTSSTRPDILDACYISARARVLCNLKPFTYVWLVNDHTFGGEAGRPNPGLMIAVNDEATGMIVDAVSRSPFWKSSLIVIIEDDPQDGADHVDTHRSILVMASPWVKRGYVSHGHYDVASLHKLFAHIYGLPYNNDIVASAAVPFDMFTSTPDYSPFEYIPRKWADGSCNAPGTRSAVEAEAWGWDFTDPDDQPGLSEQVWRMLHVGEI